MSKYRITLEGKTYEMEVVLVPEETAPEPAAKKAYREFRNASKDSNVNLIDPSAQKPAVNSAGVVTAPMPGTVIRIEKAEGDAVRTGELVLVLEAMKMENEIFAPADGVIRKICCRTGGTVAGGEELFEIE